MSSERYNHVKDNKKAIFFNNLLGGVAWGLGATIGLSIVLTVAGIIISKVNTVPIVGDYVQSIANYIADKQETALEAVDKKEN